MSKRNRLGEILPYMLLWLFFSLLAWGFVFSLLTDTEADKKLTVYLTVPTRFENELALEIEECFSGEIQMAKVKPFTYFLFGKDELEKGDAFVVRESEKDDYADWFEDEGTKIASKGAILLNRFLEFPVSEAYFLFAGKNSEHIEDGLRDELIKMLLKEDGK